MTPRFDLTLVGNDLYIDPFVGDFDIGISDVQHVQDTITAFPGWWKQYFPDGVGIFAYQNSNNQNQVLARNTIQQLQSDGYQCNNPIITQSPDGTLLINPNVQ